MPIFLRLRSHRGALYSQTDMREFELSIFEKPSPMDEDDCLYRLRHFCLDNHMHVPNDMLFRFACFYDFDFERTKDNLIKKHRSRYLYLRMEGALAEQFMCQILFPLTGLKTKHTNSDVIYMRPARYHPSRDANDLMVDNLCYVLNHGSRSQQECRNGMAFLANMNGYTIKNIHQGTIMKMMQMLQGDIVPTKIRLLIFVDPPTVFTRAWKAAKKVASGDFLKNVYFIRQERLGEFLMDGYKEFLPNEFVSGWRQMDEMVEDYVDMMKYQDAHPPSR